MKSTVPKTSAKNAGKNSPFFSKESGGEFFSKPASNESFFSNPTKKGNSIQRKLRVGQANDKYEKEADSVAESVVNDISNRRPFTEPTTRHQPVSHSITPLVQNKCAECEKEDQLNKKEELQKGKLQRKPIFESNAEPPDDQKGIQRKCAHCEEEEKMQRKEACGGSPTVSPSVESTIAGSKGKGEQLPSETNESMSNAFGSDFSNVRIHRDAAAAQMSSHMNAQAFAHGNDIYFNSGKYSTNDTAGKRLLAHELTHTVQQGAEGKKIQRDPVKCDEAATTKPSIDDVTNNCPIDKGKITDSPKTIIISKLKVKQNAPDSILAALPKPNTLPKPGSRKETPTKQVSLWGNDVEPLVIKSLESLLTSLNTDQDLASKKDNKNKYTLKLKTGKGETTLTGTFTELVKGARVSKWNTDGKTMPFQVEHILDYQIAGAKADDVTNLMLLSASVNNTLGSVMKEYIRSDIAAILDHYNKYVAKGTLVTKSDEARANYDIKAADTEKIDPDVPKDQEIVKKSLTDASTDPLRSNLSEMGTLNLKKGEFILKSNKKGGGVILPYAKKDFNIGSYKLTTDGDPVTESISSITATQIITGGHTTDPPETKTYALTPVPGETKAYKAKDFGFQMASLKLKYLSPIEFDEPDLDENLNIEVTGRIKTPGPSFLSKTPIELKLIGRELIIQKTFSSSELGNVGPIEIDEASLTLSLSTKSGLGAMGMVAFSIPNTGKGSIEAKGNKEGFTLAGKFAFDSKTFNPALIEVGYDSVKDNKGENPWIFKGTVGIPKDKVKGINSANIKVGYSEGELTLDGNADLNVPAVKSAAIKARYKQGAFKITLDTKFDFKSKYIKDPEISVTLGSDDTGWTLGVSGSANIVIPNYKTIGLKVTYLDGLFDASAKIDDLKVGKYVSGSILLGATNANVNEKGEAAKTGEGKQLLLYGSGEITITVGENIKSTLGVKLNKDGKILITGKLKVNKEKLLKKDLLNFHHEIFKISSPKVPIFSIGIGDIFLQVAGGADAMASISSPMVTIEVDLKETDIFNPKAFTIATSITPEIEAEAGLDLKVSFIIGARALVFVVKADISGTLQFHVKAGAQAQLDLTWSAETGMKFKHAEGRLNGGIVVGGKVSGGLTVELDLFLTTIPVWNKEWTLAEMKFGDLGALAFKFPIDFDENGAIITPNTDKMQPETPYTDPGKTGQLLSDKAGGENKVEKKPEEFKKEILDFFRTLPAIGPSNPLYSQNRSRHYFVNEIENSYKEENWQWLRSEWANVERQEFNRLADDLRQPRSEKVEKSVRLKQFEIDHTTVPKSDIDLLASELKLYDLSTGQTPVQKKPIFESDGKDKEDTVQKKIDGGRATSSGSVESSLKSSAGKGAELPPSTRDEMESSIGSGFSDVKIHDDSHAQSMSDELTAQAFTHGKDIYFNKGKYDTTTKEGKELLAHELTHVVQQTGNVSKEAPIMRKDGEDGPTPDKKTSPYRAETMVATKYPRIASALSPEQYQVIQKYIDARLANRGINEEVLAYKKRALEKAKAEGNLSTYTIFSEYARGIEKIESRKVELPEEDIIYIDTFRLIDPTILDGQPWNVLAEREFRERWVLNLESKPVYLHLSEQVPIDNVILGPFWGEPGSGIPLPNEGGLITFKKILELRDAWLDYENNVKNSPLAQLARSTFSQLGTYFEQAKDTYQFELERRAQYPIVSSIAEFFSSPIDFQTLTPLLPPGEKFEDMDIYAKMRFISKLKPEQLEKALRILPTEAAWSNVQKQYNAFAEGLREGKYEAVIMLLPLLVDRIENLLRKTLLYRNRTNEGAANVIFGLQLVRTGCSIALSIMGGVAGKAAGGLFGMAAGSAGGAGIATLTQETFFQIGDGKIDPGSIFMKTGRDTVITFIGTLIGGSLSTKFQALFKARLAATIPNEAVRNFLANRVADVATGTITSPIGIVVDGMIDGKWPKSMDDLLSKVVDETIKQTIIAGGIDIAVQGLPSILGGKKAPTISSGDSSSTLPGEKPIPTNEPAGLKPGDDGTDKKIADALSSKPTETGKGIPDREAKLPAGEKPADKAVADAIDKPKPEGKTVPEGAAAPEIPENYKKMSLEQLRKAAKKDPQAAWALLERYKKLGLKDLKKRYGTDETATALLDEYSDKTTDSLLKLEKGGDPLAKQILDDLYGRRNRASGKRPLMEESISDLDEKDRLAKLLKEKRTQSEIKRVDNKRKSGKRKLEGGTMGVSSSDVGGFEGVVTEGASKYAGGTPDPTFKPPSELPQSQGHAEQNLAGAWDRRFTRGVANGKINADPSALAKGVVVSPQLEGKTIRMHIEEDVCGLCKQSLNPRSNATAGVLKKFSQKYPQLTIEITAEGTSEVIRIKDGIIVLAQ